MNETNAEIQVPAAGDALALRQLQHVGAAYGLIFVLIFVFAWKATSATRRLAERVDELEREGRRGR